VKALGAILVQPRQPPGKKTLGSSSGEEGGHVQQAPANSMAEGRIGHQIDDDRRGAGLESHLADYERLAGVDHCCAVAMRADYVFFGWAVAEKRPATTSESS
jgi:hypothetical protein